MAAVPAVVVAAAVAVVVVPTGGAGQAGSSIALGRAPCLSSVQLRPVQPMHSQFLKNRV